MFGGNLGAGKFVEMWRRRELSHPRNTRSNSRIFEIGDDAGRCVRCGERGHSLCRGLPLSSSNMGQCSGHVGEQGRGEGWLSRGEILAYLV